MILGVGVDLIEVARIQRALENPRIGQNGKYWEVFRPLSPNEGKIQCSLFQKSYNNDKRNRVQTCSIEPSYWVLYDKIATFFILAYTIAAK